ncbi:OmpA family protein [Sinimarinibacterium flocculans]|uniref:OmpA family protein n=1 Tax=Sinimarinibacterium flocculans TaxID=985250 RepID=UPI0035157266
MIRKRQLLALAAAWMGVALPGPSAAQDDSKTASAAIENRFYVSPMASYIIADPDRSTDDGVGGTLVVGKMFRSQFGIELEAIYNRYDPDDGGDSATLVGGGLRGILFPSRGNYYGLLGLGYGRFEDHPGADPEYDSALVTLGLGYLLGPFDFIASGISLRAEAALRTDIHSRDQTADSFNNALNEGLFNLGLLIPLGPAARPLPPPEPEPVAVVEPVEVADSDGDGVADPADQCPDTPPGTTVDEQGCPLSPPACETGEAGQGIELGGCQPGETIVLRGVNFEFDKATLTVNARTLLDDVASALTNAPQIRVEVGGHTDSRGSDTYNQELSERRAQSVVDHLVGKGIAPDRLQAAGYGEAAPVADNDTDEGRELNRRVELRIIE